MANGDSKIGANESKSHEKRSSVKVLVVADQNTQRSIEALEAKFRSKVNSVSQLLRNSSKFEDVY